MSYKKIGYLALVALMAAGSINAWGQDVSETSKSLIGVIQEDALVVVNLEKNEIKMIDQNGCFSFPMISKDGKAIAYKKDKDLYVAVLSQSLGEAKCVVKDVASYAWLNGNLLVYSLEAGGLYGYSLVTGKTMHYKKDQIIYRHLTIGKALTHESNFLDNIIAHQTLKAQPCIYAEAFYKVAEGEEEALGIVVFESIFVTEEKIVFDHGKLMINEVTDHWEQDEPGMIPSIAALSKNGENLYIWGKYHSTSLNTDGVRLGIYETKTKSFHLLNEEDVYALSKYNSLALNPVNSHEAIINLGGDRQMNFNKSLGLLNIQAKALQYLLPKEQYHLSLPYGEEAGGLVTMSPTYSVDGKRVAYGASVAEELSWNEWLMSPHFIYEMDLRTKKSQQLTNQPLGFDAYPLYINSEDLIFLRRNLAEEDESYSLYLLRQGKEQLLVDEVKPIEKEREEVLTVY